MWWRGFIKGGEAQRRQAREFLRFLGPGILVTVGFIDPGNWASNVAVLNAILLVAQPDYPLTFPASLNSSATALFDSPVSATFAPMQAGQPSSHLQLASASPHALKRSSPRS